MILRINNSNIYTDSEKDNLVNTKEYYLSELLKIYIEKDFCIKIDKCELKYLTNILSNKRHIDNNIIEVDQIIYIKKFLKSLSTRLNIDLTNDEFLIDNLSKHMKPAIERMKIGISSSNPLLDTVKSKYTDIYVSVITSIEEIEDYEHIYFDSNEIGYICLHIIAAINKPSNQIKYNTALICNEGLSVEIFLKNLIEISFNEIQINKIYRNLNVLTELDSKYDLILNSTNIILQSKKSINISTIPNKEDNIKINNFFLKKNKLSNNSSNKLLSFHLDSCENSYELIQKYCNYLTINNFTTDNFYQTVIQRFKISNTYIARGIALLHGSKSEVSESTLLVIKLNEVIEW
jgi:transcriptional antiterminator